jgi:hypothetical protein
MGLWRPGKGRVWFRVHDPRVFRHLRWLLTPAQMAEVMGPVHAWTWHEPLGGTWRTHHRPDAHAPFGLLLQPDQWLGLEQLGVINACLRDLVVDPATAGSGALRALMEGVLEARDAGLDDVRDLSLYARQRLHHGPGFRHRRDVASRLARLRGDGMSYSMATRLEAGASAAAVAA